MTGFGGGQEFCIGVALGAERSCDALVVPDGDMSRSAMLRSMRVLTCSKALVVKKGSCRWWIKAFVLAKRGFVGREKNQTCAV
jgi:hypothetical protein